MTAAPATQRALVVDDKDEVVILNKAPCPQLPADQVLVRTEAVGLNPSDTKMRGPFVTPFATLGADYAGTVMAVGSEVIGIKVGDRGQDVDESARLVEYGSGRIASCWHQHCWFGLKVTGLAFADKAGP
ncbi:hypothetical protein Daus18300_000110 [Diaporthe australafricana]|uniref:Alcohol dehydrogenase-like N-terminal domain-containing protein n=1 Tax=Diaporthe australafricana TaxID=127596 RepID=A0ABR3Y6T8_9PEZI